MYYHARVAIKDTKDPTAYLRLGRLYAQGIGTRENHALANYFYEKALAMGCQEAESFIDLEYDSGRRSVLLGIKNVMLNDETDRPDKYTRFKRQVERERIKKNYGILSQLRSIIPLFYPNYNQEKGFNDFINDRETIDADICFALSTSDNGYDFNLEQLDNFLKQLYAPITQNKSLIKEIRNCREDIYLLTNEIELLQGVVNLTASYKAICRKHHIKKMEFIKPESLDFIPYIKMSTLSLLRRQTFKCLLSIKKVDPLIEEYLNNLEDNEKLLTISDLINNNNIKLFLISYVEVNYDIQRLEGIYQPLLYSFRKHHLGEIATHLNNYTERLSEIGFEHNLPEFTEENLPPIELG